jgi:hypothetical protein
MKIKNLSLYCAFTFLCLLLSFSSKASHVDGGEITWKNLNADTFLVTFTGYRECNGLSFPARNLTLSCGKSSSIVNVSTTMSKGKDITPVYLACTRCGKVPNTDYGVQTCKSPYGIEVFYYTAKVNLKKYTALKGCCTLYASMDDLGSRSQAITTGASGENSYFESSINICHGKQSTVSFTNPPLLIVSQNECISYNPGAVDFDLDSSGRPDSLVYSLTKPREGSSNYSTWSSGYSFDKPFYFDSFPYKNAQWNPPTSCAGFHLDSATGELYFRPRKVETTIMAIKVEEFRKDKTGKAFSVGYVIRDMCIAVQKSGTNNVPTITGINGNKVKDTSVLAGQNVCFDIFTNDTNAKDTVSLSWNKSLLPFGATFTPQTGKKHPTATFCWNTMDSFGRSYPYQFVVEAQDDARWVNGRTFQSYRVIVRPDHKDTITITPTRCGVNFNASPKKWSLLAHYLWKGDAGLYSTSSNFIYQYKKPGIYKYSLTVDDGYGFGHTDSGKVVVTSAFTVHLPADTTVCPGSEITIKPKYFGGIAPYIYDWNVGSKSSNISAIISNPMTLIFTVSDSNCTATDTMHIKTFPAPVTPSITLIGLDSLKASLAATQYTWYRDSIKLTVNTRQIFAGAPGKYAVQIEDSNGCLSPISSPYAYISTGVQPIELKPDIRIYPNPTTGLVNIEYTGLQTAKISVLNITSQVQFETIITTHAELDLHNLPKGIYLLKIQSMEGCRVERVILR